MFHKSRYIVFIGLLASSVSPFTTAATDTSSCHTTEHSSGWLMLSAQCDIGTGLWGKEPTTTTGHFWVQCNYSKAIPAKSFSDNIIQHFPQQSFLIYDKARYRCLIGPLASFSQAKRTQQALNQLGVTQSFIRHATSPQHIVQLRQSPSAQANPTTQPVATQVDQDSQPPQQQSQTLVENRVVLNAALYSFTFKNLNYYQPRNIQSSQEMPPAFVKENAQYWSRINITDAGKWCERYGLRLPSFEELSQLQTYGQRFLLRNHWPIEMNYWSNTVSSYSGEIKTLNLRSGRADEYRPLALLYTTCVNDAN
ncbi:SPOR domain-containing protein [Photobacterium nomapromontoriensis]|uniref:SPOR domain-containing protein n=1 Tax=Photobacterium nomapromontoriensis TaxID=2910237 RepID=UPI003D1190DF